MPLLEGGIYRVPDGRLFRAEREIRRYGKHDDAWVLVPLETHTSEGHAWRDELSKLLFFEEGMIVYFVFHGLSVEVRNTGWKTGDLKLEKPAPR